MNSYIKGLTKYRNLLLVLLFGTIILALFGVLKLKLNTDFSLFTTQESVYEDRLDEMNETFGSSDQMILLIEGTKDPDYFKTELRQIQAFLENQDEYLFVQGPTPASMRIGDTVVPIGDISGTDWQLAWEQMEEFSPLKEQDDIPYGAITLLLSEEYSRHDLQDLESYLTEFGYTYYLAGDTYNQLKVVDYILNILFLLPPLAILIILLVFFLQLGGIKPTMLSVLPAIVGSIWTFGIIGWLGNEVSILTAVVPVFIIVIGSADGLHFITHMQVAKTNGLGTQEAIVKTLKMVGVPMIITTLTSMAGFLSLLSIETGSITDLAIFASVGIFLAGVATWFVLPLVLTTGLSIEGRTHRFQVHLASPIKRLWGIPSYAIALVLVVLGVVFYGRIANEFDMLSVYKDRTEVAKNASKVQDVLGGSIPIYILYEQEDVLTIDVMNDIDRMIASLEDEGLIHGATNPFRILQIFYQNNLSGTIPNNLILELIYLDVRNSQSTPMDELIDTEAGIVRILVFPTNMENDTLAVIETSVTTDRDGVSVTGVQYLLRELNVSIGAMQVRSILLAIAIVFVLLLVTLRSIKLALISILPILVTVSTIYGAMGLFGIPLNITTVIIFSIAIGVGIDYAVHFSSVYRHLHTKQTSSKDALEQTYQLVSKPILANAMGISLGLSVLFASTLMIHTYVSSLMWVAMVVSVFITLTLIPSILTINRTKAR